MGRLEREADSLVFTTDVRVEWRCYSASPYAFVSWAEAPLKVQRAAASYSALTPPCCVPSGLRDVPARLLAVVEVAVSVIDSCEFLYRI
jgi:hypothetical protein